MSFIPHTEDDVRDMLSAIGAPSVEALFDEIPAELKLETLEGLPPALTEMEASRLLRARAAQDGEPLCFIGAGAYEHFIPSAVWAIASRGEFYSAYTPYQAEASQGTLQVIYEFQSMLASLTAMEVANASLYDGASALAESCLMAVRAQRGAEVSRRILVPRTLNPTYLKVARSICGNQELVFDELPYDVTCGLIDERALEAFAVEPFAALIIAYPNFFGHLENVHRLTDWAHEHGALVIAVINPVALAVLVPPGQWGRKGADIACGEGQPLGSPLSSGGPYVGLMTTRMSLVRQMPGRIVGRTTDLQGRPGFTLTLQAREQHIRRSKATSNICTNQGLVVTAACIYLSLLGAQGLARVARASMRAMRDLVHALSQVPGVQKIFEAPAFHETVIRMDCAVKPVLEALAARGILAGLDLSDAYPELGNAFLVCATETKSDQDIATFARCLREVLSSPSEPRTAS